MSTKYTGGFITKSPVAPTTTAASGIWTLDQQQQAQKAGTWPSPPNYIEEVFSTYLYTGAGGASITINNGIDVSGKGGLVWLKNRGFPSNHSLQDTTRPASYQLSSNTTGAQSTTLGDLTSFNNNGFSLGTSGGGNNITGNVVSWTFREQPKFFDVVTYTGDGTSYRDIAHSLNSVPACMIVKVTSTTGDWFVYHKNLATDQYYLKLNTTAAQSSASSPFDLPPTSTVFTVGYNVVTSLNTSGATYVAYLFAHDAGGFGLTGTDNAISCGSFTTSAGGAATVTLGYEPQWMLLKQSSGTAASWTIVDSMRGFVSGPATTTSDDATLNPNNANEEGINNVGRPTATGFEYGGSVASQTFIYIAIRRGPMKVPTLGTSVFEPIVATLNNGTISSTGSVGVVDALIPIDKGTTADKLWQSRLTGGNWLATNSTAAENSSGYTTWDRMTGAKPQPWSYGDSHVIYNLKRAPSFFDEVCYTGTGANRTVTHNLAAVPELMIIKDRSADANWSIYSATLGATQRLRFNDQAPQTLTGFWNNTAPTSSVFTVGTYSETNQSGDNFVAYLFATCAGVSKVGSYTGTGAAQTINCGFTSGARFVLIKRTDSTGDWWTYDSARGITSGNDPYLYLNSTVAEVTNTNYVDTDTTGFKVTAAAPAGLNANGGTFIFLAIA